MALSVSFVSRVDDLDAFSELLQDYYTIVLKTLETAGGPVLNPRDLVTSSIAHLDEMLPPDGRLALAHDSDGRLVGCGAMRRISPTAVEMKRMFVRPEVQGQGLGRRLFQMRIDEAKAMGCTHIYADTAKGNRPMLAMYEAFGFHYISRYDNNANPPELAPHLVFLEYRIPD